MRSVNDTVCQWPCGRYSVCVLGDEILLLATNDEDAMIEGALVYGEILHADLLDTMPS